jgi:vanadium-dependent haloperoxidase-like protein
VRTRSARPRFALAAVAAVVAVATFAPVGAAADPDTAVQRWNATALAALMNAPSAATPGAGQPPTVGAIHMAMVQGAVYDAVDSIVGGFEPYLDVPAAPSDASMDAAVISAAHDVLTEVIPLVAPLTDTTIRDAILARIETQYTNELGAISASSQKVDGEAAGAAAAGAMLADRADDGRFPSDPFTFTSGTGIGEWRPTNGVSDPFAWVARVRPFTLPRTSRFRTAGPNPVGSDAYTEDYNEVKASGAATGSTRTAEQTAVATFYIPNPVEMFNRTFRTIATDNGLDQADQARLFAMLNMAGADALINCWDDKAYYSFWRPVTAIQLGDTDGNSATVGDASWQPFISTFPGPVAGTFLPTPPYPDHPSGYACLTSSMMHTGKHFFGTNRFPFTVTRIAGTSVTSRDYPRFGAVVNDVIDARVWLGIHFRTADEQAALLGKKVARWLHERFFLAQE